jgi:PIN domain nuclease of toxin-antitoxin system
MKYLLDTHALIWYITDDTKIPKRIAGEIESCETDYVVSIASLWEIGIKYSLKKIDLAITISELFTTIEQSKIKILSISTKDILSLLNLPDSHRDPFDRIIIAQAQNNYLTVVTKDQVFASYNVETMWG